MAVNYYKCEYGVFSVIVGDAEYEAINTLPADATLVDDNGLTSDGSLVFSTIPANSLISSVTALENVPFDPAAYNRIAEYIPLISIKKIPTPSTTTTTTKYKMLGSDEKFIQISQRVRKENLDDLRFTSYFYMDDEFFGSIQGDSPFGYIGLGHVDGTTPDKLNISFIYCDSTFSKWGYLFFTTYKKTRFQRRSYEGDTRFKKFFDGITPIEISTDPYEPGGEIEPGGGTGDFDNTSDPIDFPSLPELSAVDTGFITLFNPTAEQLKNLSSYMWSDLFDVEGWKKIFANPMDAILGLTIVPVAVPNVGTRVVSVGNISTGIAMNLASGQYIEVDCGTLNVNEYWGAYLDYDPYTKAEIYLPFIGIHALSTDDIMNKPVHVKYHIDLLSGACCAYVKCGNSVLYSFVGQCSCSVPINSTDWTNIINGALSIAGAIGSMVATNGATAPMGIGTIASAAVNSLKPSIEKSGSMGGMGGMLGVQQPYIILTRPRQALPSRLNTYSGYPSFMTKGLGELSGYTRIDSIHIENVPATGSELTEIESLLKEGVIL